MITSAAIKYPNGEVVSGFDRHYKVIALQARFGILSKEGTVQGFVNHKDEFLNRAQAKKEAIASGQLDPKHKGILYSEDLWRESVFSGEACD